FGVSLNDQRSFYYVVLSLLVITVLAVVGMRRSRTGRALIACRDNEALAQSYGINLVRARLGAFAVSGFIAGFAGGLFAYAQHGVQAQNFTVTQGIQMFLIAVIGGMGSIAGPLIGAAFFGTVNMLTSISWVALFVTGLGVIIVLL